ncbi:MAG: hypothetical protein K1X75_14345 [Leptospirales bacterium]|nr:hypothetical protein [Leptospirales bacterium]
MRRIRLSDYTVTTLAGQTGLAGTTDGIGQAATLPAIIGMGYDFRYLYLPDSGSQVIRRVDVVTARVDTIAGQLATTGANDGPASSATFNSPRGAASDGVNVYIGAYNNNRIRVINTLTWQVSSLATFPAAALEGNLAIIQNAIFAADFSGATIKRID